MKTRIVRIGNSQGVRIPKLLAPMTTKGTSFPTRVACKFRQKHGQVVLDQIRTVDKSRLVKKLGKLESQTQEHVLSILGEMFAP